MPDSNVYVFGTYRLDAGERALYSQGRLVALTPKALDTLCVLVSRAGHIVSKEELMQAVWPDTFVEDGNLSVNIFALRKALGESANSHTYIETVPRRGFRFVAPIHLEQHESPELAIQTRTRLRVITEEVEETQPDPPEAAAALAPAAALPALPIPRSLPNRTWWLMSGIGVLLVIGSAGWLMFGKVHAATNVTFSGNRILAWDGTGRMAWQYEIPNASTVTAAHQVRSPVLIADFNGAGSRNVLIAARAQPADHPRGTIVSDSFYCFSQAGRLLWSLQPEVKLRFGGQEFDGPWVLTDVALSSDTPPRIWLAYQHYTWWPSFVVEVDAQGNQRLRFVNSGAITSLAQVRGPQGGSLTAAGINNDYNQAMLAVLPDDQPFAVSPQRPGSGYFCQSCPSGSPAKYLLFPRSELNQSERITFNNAVQLRFESGRTVVSVVEVSTPQDAFRYGAEAFYELGADFQPRSVAMGDSYWALHQQLFQEGKLRHSAEDCPERRHPRPVRVWTPAKGWSDVEIRYASATN